MRQLHLIVVFLSLIVKVVNASTEPGISIDWEVLTSIPPAKNQTEQPGLAGAFIGIHNGALIIGGGANFPNGPAWIGGQKVFHDDLYVLERLSDGSQQWFQEKQFSLPQKIAYGLSIPTHKGLLCAGGTDGNHFFDEVLLIQWNAQGRVIEIENLPALPKPCANMSGGLIGTIVYIAAGSTTDDHQYFWSLSLDDPTMGWQSLPTWSGKARTHAIGVVQNDGENDCFYLFKGRKQGANGISELFSDGYVYDPKKNRWKEINETDDANTPFNLSAGTGLAIGANHIFLFGGAEGTLLNRLETLGSQIQEATDQKKLQLLEHVRDSILLNHQGFTRDIWAFHTITQTWTKIGLLPSGSQVTTTALKWDDQLIIPTGEITPCIRTPDILSGQISHELSFGKLNFLVLFVYLIILVGMGLVLSKNQHSTNDFFKGGNRIPWWAAGLSIFGTQLSAITFMAVPAKTFATDWLYFFLMVTIILVAPFIIKYFLPFFRRYNLTTAYEYLELRFNLLTRLLGSTMYIFLQLGRLGIVLLLPSLALSVVTGIDVNACILTMGLLSILYTVLGGIEAVIWTDVIQVIVLMGGALLSLVLLFLNLDLTDISTYVGNFEKTKIFDFSLNISNPTLWVVLIGGFASNIVQYGSDQTVIQRYLTTKDEKSAARGITTGAWMTLPATLIFFSLGTLLFVYYKVNPTLLNPALEKTDTIFPWYIINSLPNGVSGLLIAAIFAASMSSLDSSMNSVSTVITTDFFRRLLPPKSEKEYLKIARIITVIIGALGTGIALLMAGLGISSLWDQFNLIVGLFAGGLGGVFVLGIFLKASNGTGAVVGLIASGIIQFLVKEYTDIHLLLYAFTGMTSCIVIGYLVSLFVPEKQEAKLTYTIAELSNQT